MKKQMSEVRSQKSGLVILLIAVLWTLTSAPAAPTNRTVSVDVNTGLLSASNQTFFTDNGAALSNAVVSRGFRTPTANGIKLENGNGSVLVSNVAWSSLINVPAFQPASGVLSNLALGNAINLISNVVATSGTATDATKQPISGVLSNLALGNASGIASNLTGAALATDSVNSQKLDAATRALLGTGGGASPAGLENEVQINDGAGGLAAIPGFYFDGTFLSVTNDTGAVQIYLRLKGNDSFQNVPFRISADTDVPADFVTINQDMSFIAVSTDPDDSSGHADPSGQNVYFGIRSIASKTLAFYAGDSSRPDWTIYNGADGVNVASASDYNIMHQGETTIHDNATITGNLTIGGTITGGISGGAGTNLNQIQVVILTNNTAVTLTTNFPLQFLELRQNGVGGWTNTWPAAVVWPGGTLPTITTNADRADYFQFLHDRTNWLGVVLGQNYLVVTNVSGGGGGGGGGSALSLDGSSGTFVTVPSSTDFDLPLYTVECWVKSSTVPSGANKGLIGNKDGGYVGFNFGQGDGGTLYFDANASDYGQTDALGAGFWDGSTWHHLAVTYDGSALKWWVDGVLSNTVNTAGAGISSSGTLEIGSSSGAGFGRFIGAIDQARISSGAVYTVDFSGSLPSCLTNVVGTTIALWKFDEGTGTSAADDTGNGHDGTLGGAATWETGECTP